MGSLRSANHQADGQSGRFYRTVSLPQAGWQVLGENLNCSESEKK
jgi:hypothetical protein